MSQRAHFGRRNWFFVDSPSLKKSNKKPVAKARQRSARSNFQFERLEVRHLLAVDLDTVITIGSTGIDQANDLIQDAAGNSYVTGFFSGTVDFDPGPNTVNMSSAGGRDIFVTKSNAQGELLWARRFGGAQDDAGVAIRVNEWNGEVFVTGWFRGTVDFDPGAGVVSRTSNGESDVFLSLLSSSGNYLNASSFGGSQNETVVADANDASLVLAGSFEGTVDFDPGSSVSNLVSAGSKDCYLLNLTWDLNYMNAQRWGNFSLDSVEAVAITDRGTQYVSGKFGGTVDFNPAAQVFNLTAAASNDIFISSFEPAGGFRWAKQISHNSSLGWQNNVSDLTVDSENNFLITGNFYFTTDFDPGPGTAPLTSLGWSDMFVAKYDSGGNYLWARAFHGSGHQQEAQNLYVDHDLNVYTTGSFYDAIDFDPGPETASLSAAAGAFLSQLDRDGNYVHASIIASSGAETSGLAVDQNGLVQIAGYFYSQSDFDPGMERLFRSPVGNQDVFVTKLSPDVKFELGSFSATDVTLRKQGNNVQLINNANAQIVESFPMNLIRNFTITGQNENADLLTVDLAVGGPLSIDGEFKFVGGSEAAGSDSLTVIGLADQMALYRPGEIANGTNRIWLGSQPVALTDVEALSITGFASTIVETQLSTDVLSINPATGFNGAIASRISGTTGGDSFVPMTFDNVRNLTLDVGAKDGTLALANDNVTFTTGSLEATGLQNLTVIGGKGADNLVINSVDLGLPVSGGAFRFDGGAGSDRLAVTGDADFRINDARIVSSNGGMVIHDEVERATLNGGAANNILIGVGYSGALILNGLGGNDLLRGGTGTNTILGGIGDDRLFGNHGNDSLDGGSGNDQLFGGLGDDTLNGGAGVDLLWFDGTNNADSLRLQFLTATTANFIRKPRGLVSVLEQDSIVYDATDEVVVNAVDGDDLITIDAAFTILGLVDGGNGSDTCTSPAAWTKVSC